MISLRQNDAKEIVAESIPLWQVGFLLAIGIAANYAEPIISLSWAFVFIVSIWGYLKNAPQVIWYSIAASPAMEVWARMTKPPLLPYEVGKYYLLFAIVLLWAHNIRNGSDRPYYAAGKIMLWVLVPSLLVNIFTFDYGQWVFNALGIIELGLLLILTSRERWTVERFCKTLQYALMPIIPVAIYLVLSASDFSQITFELKSNAAASGGFASNQVSTIIGMGIVLLLLLRILRRPLFPFAVLDYALLALLVFRGLLTFSRGGMVVAAIALVVAFYPNIFHSVRSFARFAIAAVLIAGLCMAIFLQVNSISGNQLLLRYQGETYNTLISGEKNIHTVTSDREDIVLSDIAIFKDSPFFGVGPGISQKQRSKYGYANITAHTEFSRLMSEHGVGGVGMGIALLVFAAWWVARQKIAAWRGIVGALFVLAILTTFHAAMRTNVATVMYALAAIPVFYHANNKRYG